MKNIASPNRASDLQPPHLTDKKADSSRHYRPFHLRLAMVLLLTMTLVFGMRVFAGVPVMPSGGDTNQTILDSWSFGDTNYWTTDQGFSPISFTNIAVSYSGPGNSLLIDSTNSAWLQYNVFEMSGATNLMIESEGSLMFWFYPDWASTSSTNMTGYGPGVPGRFIEVGATNSPAGWWGFYMDEGGNNLCFSAQDGYGDTTNYLSGPVTFSSNSWHLIALSWTSTNTSLYVDGQWVTNGSGLSVLPPSGALTNGFTIGSDLATGTNQMHGAINDLLTFNYAIETNQVQTEWALGGIFYGMNQDLIGNLTNAPFSPDMAVGFYDIVGGRGILQVFGTNIGACGITNSEVRFTTNVAGGMQTNGSVNLTFVITGGNPFWPYDVFATGLLTDPKTNSTWVWLGQAYQCQEIAINGFTNSAAYLILGTPQDSDGDGLTDAYERLVTHTDPNNAYSMGDGIPDGWKVLNGLSATNSVSANDPDGDGLSNLDEYLYGTNPRVSEGMNIWVASPVTTSGIP